MLSPEETFGMIAIEAYLKDNTVVIGKPDTWVKEPILTHTASDPLPQTDGSSFASMQILKQVRVQHDQAYLYLRLDVQNLDPDNNGTIEWSKVRYLIGIDTYDSKRGDAKLDAKLPITLKHRIEFVLEIGGDKTNKPTAVLKVTPEYDTYGIWHGVANPRQLFRSVPTNNGIFNPLKWIMEDDLQDGRNPKITVQKRQEYPIGTFRYGHQNPDKKDEYDALAHFYADAKASTISVRIPWSLLNITDPSKRHVLHDNPLTRGSEHKQTAGLRFVAAALKPDENGSFALSDVLPGGPQPPPAITTLDASKLYTWKDWGIPTYKERIRPVYYEMKTLFKTFPKTLPAPILTGGTP
jgi:hypothetical protein